MALRTAAVATSLVCLSACSLPSASLGDAGTADAGLTDAGVARRDAGECIVDPVPGGAWASGECPDAGCGVGSYCVRGIGESTSVFGCAPIAPSCQGTPSCACMACACAIRCVDSADGFLCDNGTISRREFKADVVYLSANERESVARQTLQIPLARYRYEKEPVDARRRLGFIINDQPNPSPAVMEDRLHVDEYGYASMLLATVQEQARELAELKARLERLERQRAACK
jgi:hypothetical protein